MPLLDLKTDLTSLKYGMDRPGGGSSEQPFIIKDIPGREKSFLDQIEEDRTGKYGMSVGNDFGFRNALLYPGTAFDDVERIFKLYTKTRVGLAFNAKQVALGLLSEPTAVWNPLAIPAQELLNIPGFGHVPAFINPDVRNFFSQPFPGPTDFRSVSDSNALKPGESDVYQMGNPAAGTNPFFKGKIPGTDNQIGTSIVRSRQHYNVVYDKKAASNLNVKRDTPLSDITPLKSTADQTALIPLYTNNAEDLSSTSNDFIKFKIRVIDNDNPVNSTFINFRAFIESFSDSYSATWDEQRFVGRGEAFDDTINSCTRLRI